MAYSKINKKNMDNFNISFWSQDLYILINHFRTLFLEKSEIFLYQNQIIEKTLSLKTENFDLLTLEQKKNFFLDSIQKLKNEQSQHFELLKNYHKDLVKKNFDFSLYFCEYFNSDSQSYFDENGPEFFEAISEYYVYLDKFLIVLNSLKQNFQELNKKNQSLLNEFFDNFQKKYDEWLKKEKPNEFYLPVFIPENYGIFFNEKKKILSKERINESSINLCIDENNLWFMESINELLIDSLNDMLTYILEVPDSTNHLELKYRSEKIK